MVFVAHMRLTWLQLIIYTASIILLIGIGFLLKALIELTVNREIYDLDIYTLLSVFERFLVIISLVTLLLLLIFIARYYAGTRQNILVGILHLEMDRILKFIQIVMSLLIVFPLVRALVSALEGRPPQSYITHAISVSIIVLSIYVIHFTRKRLF